MTKPHIALALLLLAGACARGEATRPGVPSLDEEEAAVDRLGLDLPALKAGTDWYRAYRANHSPAEGQRVFAILEKFRKVRARQLKAAGPALAEKVKRASSPAHVDQLLAIYAGVPFDKESDDYLAVVAAANLRKESGSTRATTTARGRGEGDGAGNAEGGARSGGGEPSEREMLAAIQDTLAGQRQNIRELAQQCEGPAARRDPVTNVRCLGVMMAGANRGDYGLKVRSFRKLGCARAMGQPGYICDYVLALAGVGTMAAMDGIMGQAEAVQGRFVPRGGRWLFIPKQPILVREY